MHYPTWEELDADPERLEHLRKHLHMTKDSETWGRGWLPGPLLHLMHCTDCDPNANGEIYPMEK